MAILKMLFPLSFNVGSAKQLIIRVLIYVVAGVVLAIIPGWLSGIPLIGFIFGLICKIIDIYVTIGIILMLLSYFNIIK